MTVSGGDPGNDEARRTAIHDELERLEESGKYSAQGQFEQAKRWRGVNFGLGTPTSVIAAVGGGMALAEDSLATVAGVLGLLAAAGTAILTTLNSQHRMNVAVATGNAYLEVQTAARQAREVDLPYVSVDDARITLERLTAKRDEQNRIADLPSRKAYKQAQKNIQGGGQTYEVDKKKRG